MLEKIDFFIDDVMLVLFGALPLFYTSLILGYMLGYTIFLIGGYNAIFYIINFIFFIISFCGLSLLKKKSHQKGI